ncbi:MAG: hypothetical protein ABI669_03435 [Usitatibacter sp.]
MSLISPREVLRQLAEALPAEVRANILVIGSLAAGYHYFERRPEWLVQTKDVDCMLSPHVKAMSVGQAVTNRLMDAGWQPKPQGRWNQPGDAATPEEELPAVRLLPPASVDWNLELMNAPRSTKDRGRERSRLHTRHGDFVIFSFGFLALAEEEPLMTEFGIAIARPEMMALANLLHHRTLGPEQMSGEIEGRRIKRANKDLGRVLALAYLASREDENALPGWAKSWEKALRSRFPRDWKELAIHAGDGLRLLLDSEQDLEEAHHTVVTGLLASTRVDLRMLRIMGERLMQDAVEPLGAR